MLQARIVHDSYCLLLGTSHLPEILAVGFSRGALPYYAASFFSKMGYISCSLLASSLETIARKVQIYGTFVLRALFIALARLANRL